MKKIPIIDQSDESDNVAVGYERRDVSYQPRQRLEAAEALHEPITKTEKSSDAKSSVQAMPTVSSRTFPLFKASTPNMKLIKADRFKRVLSFLPILLRQSTLAFSIVLLLFSVFSQTWLPLMLDRSADLTPQMRSLTGDSRDDTAQYLTTTEGGDFRFAATASELPEGGGEAEHTGRHDDAYELYAPKDAKDGITVTEKTSKIAVTLIPDFYTNPAEKVDGDHLVYTTGPNKLVYTLKYNGLKEDIIVPQYHSDNLDYSFTLRLPAGVEARKDAQGNIGIYSSDPTLFGDISFGSDEDREKIEKARMNGDKNNLVMTIPAPLIKDADGQEHYDNISFELGDKTESQSEEVKPDLPKDIPRSLVTTNDYQLTLKATNLKDLPYPISLDPTFQVADANDFSGVTPESGIDIDTTDGVIRRASLTGGVVGTLSSLTSNPPPRVFADTAVYNGHIYSVSGGLIGATPTAQNSVSRAEIGSSGDITSWTTQTGVLVRAITNHQIEIYNGYLYVLAGTSGGCSGGVCNEVSYGKIQPDGSVATMTATTTLPASLNLAETAVYNGYIYISGGTNAGAPDDEIYYAPINANGSVGSWVTSAVKLPAVRYSHQMLIHNGYLYIATGQSPTSVYPASVLYNKLNADGSLSPTWTTGSSFTGGRDDAGVTISNGYMYIGGGCNARNGNGQCTTLASNAIQYAEVYADGSLGFFRSTNNYTSGGTWDVDFHAYEGYIYSVHGCFDLGNTSSRCDTGNDAQSNYNSIKPAGELSGEVSTTSLDISNQVSFAYNGYVYSIGGFVGGGWSSASQYAPINSDGTIGAWSTTTSRPDLRGYSAHAIYNGNLYVFGGWVTSLGVPSYVSSVYYVPINTNGTLGTWNSTTNLPTNLGAGMAVIYNGTVIFAGGRNNSYSANVYTAQIASNGTIPSWTTTTSLPEARAFAGVATYKNYIYLIGGGQNNTSPLATTVYGEINSDGTISSWTTSPHNLSIARTNVSSQIINGYIYVVAGDDVTDTGVGTIELTRLNSDGTLNSWSATEGISGRTRHGTAQSQGYLFIIGGTTTDAGGTAISTTYTMRANNGGSGDLGTYTTDSDVFSVSRKLHASVAYKGYLYVLGGCYVSGGCGSSGNTTNIVSYAAINGNGSIGSWSNITTTFGGPRMRLMAFAYNDRMYIMGGRSYEATGQDLDDIRHAPIESNGNITAAWSTDDTDLPGGTGHFQASIAQNGGTIYFTGGSNTSNQDDVFYSVINESTGDMGSWVQTTSRPTATRGAWMAVYNGYIYSLGGNLSEISTVYSAQINSDNTLGSWNTISNLPIAEYTNSSSQAIVLNGYIYVISDLGPGNIPMTYYAAITYDGKLGAWQTTTQPDYSTSNAYINFSATAYGGKIYVTGGNKQGGAGACDPCQNTTYGTMQSISRIGTITRGYQFDQAVRPTTLITRGAQVDGTNVKLTASYNEDGDNTVYTNAQTFNGLQFGNAARQGLDPGANVDNVRSTLIRFVLDDTQSGIFPDDGSETEINEILYYFHPSPQGRLRGGRTFINEADRGLDVQPD